jgi:hypothetical protein
MAESTTVALLFEEAGLTVPPAELAEFEVLYPAMRKAADTLYAVPELADVAPVLSFDPNA